MNRRVGIPYIKVRIELSEFFGVVTNRSYDNARLSRFVLGRLLDPMTDRPANSAFVVEQKNWFGVFAYLLDRYQLTPVTLLPSYGSVRLSQMDG